METMTTSEHKMMMDTTTTKTNMEPKDTTTNMETKDTTTNMATIKIMKDLMTIKIEITKAMMSYMMTVVKTVNAKEKKEKKIGWKSKISYSIHSIQSSMR